VPPGVHVNVIAGHNRIPVTVRRLIERALPVTLDQIVSGDVADYLNPANYSISEESRVYAGFLNGPGGFLVNWLPGTPANFGYGAPSEEALAYWFPGTGPAIGVPAPIEAVKAALASLPSFTYNGDAFTADFSTAPGFPAVQPVLESCGRSTGSRGLRDSSLLHEPDGPLWLGSASILRCEARE